MLEERINRNILLLLYFFLLFASMFALRPETIGIPKGKKSDRGQTLLFRGLIIKVVITVSSF